MKKIAVITGSRADYDLLFVILEKLKKSKKLKFDLFVTGSHLDKRFGYSIKKIKKDGFKKNIKIKISERNSTSYEIAESISIGIKKFTKSLIKNRPNILLVLGDRYEIFSAVIAAANLKIPIAHISGGEFSEGNLDESIRHSITKFSHFHFVANELYRKTVIQLGEHPSSVFVVGGTGIDNIKKNLYKPKKVLEKILDFKFLEKNFLITFHPTTFVKKNQNLKDLNTLLFSLNKIKNCGLIFTYPNADHENNIIIKVLKKFVKKNKNSKLFEYLGKENYLSCLKIVDLIIGNSSSGITEAPFLKTPTINIGNRQKGRAQAKSIINTNFDDKEITNAIKKGMSKNFLKYINKQKTFYGNGNCSDKIVKILETINEKNVLQKKFFTIKK